MVEWHLELTNAGKPVGKLQARTCLNEDDLNDWIAFQKLPGGFAAYATQMASADIWPIAVLVDLEIYSAFQRHGFGRAALR